LSEQRRPFAQSALLWQEAPAAPRPAGPHCLTLPIQLQTLPGAHSALMTQVAPGGDMPPGSHTFDEPHASPARQGIVPEQVDPTEPPGGIETSTGPSPKP